MDRPAPSTVSAAPRRLGLTGPSVPVGWLALRHLRAARAIAVSQCAALALALGIPLALQLSSSISADAAYATAISASSRNSIATVAQQGGGTADAYQRLQSRAARMVTTQVGNRLTPIAEFAATQSFNTVTVNGRPYPLELLPPLIAMVYPALEQKAQLIAGAWPVSRSPAAPIEVTVSNASAQTYAWKVGDVVCIAAAFDRTARPTQVCLRIAGIWRQQASSDPFWLAAPPTSALTFASDGYFLFASGARHVIETVSRVYRPDPSRLTVAEAPALVAGFRRLRNSLRFSGDDLTTSLDQSIAAFLERSSVNRLPVQLVAAELIVVVLFGLGLLTQSFLASQAAACALWRIRGWSRLDIARYLSAQLLLLAVPAVVLGTAGAIGVTWWRAEGYHLDAGVLRADVGSQLGAALALSAVSAAAVLLALTLRFSWRSVSTMRRVADSPVTAAWWRTRNADLVLAVVALPLLAEAALRGEAAVREASGGIDFIGLALPIIALTLLAVAALRLLPLIVLPLRFFRSNISARLTWWRLGRRPADHAGVAVLLSLTLAVGLFASIFDSTEVSNASDRASYANGADLRIAFSPEAGTTGIRNEIAQIAGVKASTPVWRTQIQLASSSDAVVALALDPKSYVAAAWSRPGLTTPPLGEALARMSGSPSTVELPGRPDELSIWVDGLSEPASLGAVVRDRAGQVARCSFGSVQFNDWRQLRARIAFRDSPQYPLSLEQLTIHRLTVGRPASIAFASLQAAANGNLATVDDFATVRGWWTRDDAGLIAAPGIGGPQRSGAATVNIMVPPAGDLSMYPPYRGALPFLISEATMSRLALRPGDYVGLNILSHQVPGQLLATVDYVPTLYPGFVDFVVLPLDRAISEFAAALSEPQTPNEMWLSMTSGGELAAQGITSNSNINFIVNRRFQLNVAVNDPILIQLRANLVTAFTAAWLLGLLGFTVHFMTALRRRLAEHAILEANGLEADHVRRGIVIEQLVIVLFAILVGAALATIAVVVLLPSMQFGTSPEATEPPTVLRVDWNALLLGFLATAAVAALIAWLIRRVGARVNVAEEIRRLG